MKKIIASVVLAAAFLFAVSSVEAGKTLRTHGASPVVVDGADNPNAFYVACSSETPTLVVAAQESRTIQIQVSTQAFNVALGTHSAFVIAGPHIWDIIGPSGGYITENDYAVYCLSFPGGTLQSVHGSVDTQGGD